MTRRFTNGDDYDDMYLRVGDKYIRIDPNFVTPGSGNTWGTYRYNDESGEQNVKLDPSNIFYRLNPGLNSNPTSNTPSTPSTPTSTGNYLHLNDRTVPSNAPNYGAYTYNEWRNNDNPWGQNVENIRSLGNIYGDIDTEDELNILAHL